MLEQLRKSGASIFIYLIFGLLIVIFVINFAPNAGQGGGGCMGGASTPITVDGEKSNLTAYRIAYGTNGGKGRQRVYLALELLIRKEILAQAAEARGIRVTKDLVEQELKRGTFFTGGLRNPPWTQPKPWIDNIDGEEIFNYGKLKGWAGNLNVSLSSYIEEQARSMQAALMADVLRDSVTVSREEAKANYLFENTTATYAVVEFKPGDYREAMRLTDADVARFLAAHEDEVKKQYADEERTYKATKPALKLRKIFIAAHKPDAAPPPEAKPTTPTIDEAKAKLETARAAIAANKQAFADVAKQLSTDEATRATGGALGWRSVDNAQLGDTAVNEAVKALEPGAMTPVITTDAGAYLILAEEQREGDLTYEQVKADIATELAKDLWSKEAAKRAALDALTAARAGTGKNLEQLFPDVENKIKQDIKLQMENKSGAILPPQKDQLAAWKVEPPAPDEAQPPSGGAAQPAAGSAAAPAAGSAAPATGTDAPAPTTPAPSAEIVPSSDVLPAFGEVKPKVTTHGPVPRMKQLPALGDSQEAIAAVFDELSAGMLAKRVYEHGGTYVVLQLKDNAAPKVEDFDKVADDEIHALRQARGHFFVESWLRDRCETLAKDGKIKPMGDLIRETDDAGKPLPVAYQPCISFQR